MIKPLSKILAYKNDAVIQRFVKFHPEAKEEAELIFDDLKRFLWLVAVMDEKEQKGEEVPDISFSASMLIMDEIWHAFILVTEHYTDFCNTYFGKYIHHPTRMPIFEQNFKKLGEEESMEIFLNAMITAVVLELDEEVAERWFDYYFKYPVD